MKPFISIAFLIVTFIGTAASASIIDFRTSPYASTFGPDTTTDVIDGVNFTFTATARGVNGFRQSFDSAGLKFGVPGNGMYTLSIVADTNIEYTSMFGRGHNQTNKAGQIPFDIFANGALQNNDLAFVPNSFTSVSLGNIFVNAGDALLISVDYSALTGSSIFAQATLQLLNFETAASSVPLPSTIWLMVIAIPGLLGARKYKKLKFVK